MNAGQVRGSNPAASLEPRRLGYANGAWYLTAYCREREEERAFRLDRIEHLEVQSETFRARPTTPGPDVPVMEVIVRFRGDVIRWVRERQHWSFVAEEASHDELLAHYRPADLNEIAPWILGWGPAAEVIAPRELRDRLLADAGIVRNRLKPDVNRDQFLEISARATEWLRNRPGYLGRELLEDGSGEWVDLVRWATMEDALAAASAFMETPEAAAFMDAVEPESITMLHPRRVVVYE